MSADLPITGGAPAPLPDPCVGPGTDAGESQEPTVPQRPLVGGEEELGPEAERPIFTPDNWSGT